MKVKNKRSYTVEIPEVGFVDAGDSIEVPDDLGASLVEQVDAWEPVTTKATKASEEKS